MQRRESGRLLLPRRERPKLIIIGCSDLAVSRRPTQFIGCRPGQQKSLLVGVVLGFRRQDAPKTVNDLAIIAIDDVAV